MNQRSLNRRSIAETIADTMATGKLRREHQATGDLTVEALPTVYRSTVFRSALEASWAATLDSFAIDWEYEPETVTLPSGQTYLPDFRLPRIGAWLEVKGNGVPRVEKAHEFGRMLTCDCPRFRCSCQWPGGQLVLIGHPPQPYTLHWDDETDHRHYWAKAAVARRHGGHPRWTSTRGNAAWLGYCTTCRHVTWFDSPYCRACKNVLAGTHGHESGSPGIRFHRITGIAITDDHDGDTP
ncbi:hypothetical protein ACFTXJ_14620 [Streptomyces zhihengii]|uniref:hypothetical protein n=1 Tax=Streptomyces zhihengii TaxID=1818004 RepID=UPI0036353B5E